MVLLVLGAVLFVWVRGGEAVSVAPIPPALVVPPKSTRAGAPTAAPPQDWVDERSPALERRELDASGRPESADASELRDAATPADEDVVQQVGRVLKSNALAATRQVDRFCAEAKALKLKAPPERQRRRDAAVFLAGRVDWENGRVGLLHLSQPLVDRMQTPPKNWQRFTEADLVGLDFSWMRELLEYDSWSLSVSGPLNDSDSVDATSPLPNFVVLQHWAKLRLVKGRLEGDLVTAALEVRHLGDLCASTGTLLGQMIRAAMLGIERGVWESAGLTPPSDPPPSQADTNRFRQVALMNLHFLYPGVPTEVRRKALECSPMPCAMLFEAMTVSAALREVSPDAAPTLEWLSAQPTCDEGLARRLAAAPSSPTGVQLFLQSDLGLESMMRELLDGGTF